MAPNNEKPDAAPELPGTDDAWIDRIIDVLRKQPVLSGKPTERHVRANTNPLKKYNKQRGMLKRQ